MKQKKHYETPWAEIIALGTEQFLAGSGITGEIPDMGWANNSNGGNEDQGLGEEVKRKSYGFGSSQSTSMGEDF